MNELSYRAARAEARAAAKYERRVRAYEASKKLRCDACGRNNVLGKAQKWDDTTARKCRRCGYWQVAA
jgi:hypothetical protein